VFFYGGASFQNGNARNQKLPNGRKPRIETTKEIYIRDINITKKPCPVLS